MLFFLLWITLSFLVALYASQRFIGFWVSLFAALLVSPALVFLFVVALDKVKPLKA